jgi:hypothetical protein
MESRDIKNNQYLLALSYVFDISIFIIEFL